MIDAVPQEIVYWAADSSMISRATQIASAIVSSEPASPGELRQISKAEIAQYATK